MKEKSFKIIISILVVIFIATVSIYFYFKKSPSIKPENKLQQNSSVNISNVSIATSTPYTVATGSYPKFNNASRQFNDSISSLVNTEISNHASISAENWQARYDTSTPDEHISKIPKADERFEFNVESSVIRNDSKVISVLMHISQFSGGAHGSDMIYTFNYDVEKNQIITIADLANGDKQFLQKLSTKVKPILRAQLAKSAETTEDQIDTDMLNSGTEPTVDNFKTFTLNDDGSVTFYFQQYQVAAYVFGTSEVTVNLPIK